MGIRNITKDNLLVKCSSAHTRIMTTLVGDQATGNLSSDPMVNTTMPTPIRSSPKTPSTTANHQQTGTGLPSVLLTNLQSFGMSEGKDKSTKLEAVLNINKIDIACLTEIWLIDATKKQIAMDNYTHFSTVRKGSKRASGGVLFLVYENSISLL